MVAREGVLARGFWLCPAISVVLMAAVLILFRVNWWTAIVSAGLVGCLVAAVWVVIGDRSSQREMHRGDAPSTRNRGGAR